jgi:hypothetical protein
MSIRSEDCCFSELVYIIPSKGVSLVQSGHHYHLVEFKLFLP